MKTVSKALDILELFLANRDGLSFDEIITESKLKKTTVYRIVSYLVKRGFIKHREKRGKYYPGIRILDIAVGIDNEEYDNSAISYLLELSRLVNESVYLKMWYGSDLLLGDAVDYQYDISINNPKDWATMPLHNTCLGKLILGSLNSKDLARYFRYVKLEKRTSNTITDPRKLKAQLTTIRRENIAFEYEENTIGVNGIAAGIKNNEGKTIGSVFIMGNSLRLNKAKLIKIAPSVSTCSFKISRNIKV